LSEETFDLEGFYALVEAGGKERNALRQDLVRGLKDYYEMLYGYDRYGAETVFLLEERMAQPYIFGFGVHRILRDRRVSQSTKLAVSAVTIDRVRYGRDFGHPFGILGVLEFIAGAGQLLTEDLRYVLVTTAGEYGLFRGLEKPVMLSFMRGLVANSEMPAAERAFWAHSLIARHQDQAGTTELIRTVLDTDELPGDMRSELCLAWLYMRQPRLDVPIPVARNEPRSIFVAEHMPFWVTHVPSWSSPTMVRFGLASLPRFGADPTELVLTYIAYRDGTVDAIHTAVADIIAQWHRDIPETVVKTVIERGLAMQSSGSVRRRFYKLGTDLYGPQYLERATHDTAGSVRQWASRLLQKQA
jgi:hypothetical protein